MKWQYRAAGVVGPGSWSSYKNSSHKNVGGVERLWSISSSCFCKKCHCNLIVNVGRMLHKYNVVSLFPHTHVPVLSLTQREESYNHTKAEWGSVRPKLDQWWAAKSWFKSLWLISYRFSSNTTFLGLLPMQIFESKKMPISIVNNLFTELYTHTLTHMFCNDSSKVVITCNRGRIIYSLTIKVFVQYDNRSLKQ